MRPLEDRPGADGEILFALVAAVEATLARRDALAEAAVRTTDAVRPQTAFEVDPRRLLVREHLEKLEGRNGALAHGTSPCSARDYHRSGRGSQVYNSHKFSEPC